MLYYIIYTCVYIYIYTYMCIIIYIYIYYTYIYIYTHVFIYMHIACMYTSLSLYIYIYIHIYVHTCIHIAPACGRPLEKHRAGGQQTTRRGSICRRRRTRPCFSRLSFRNHFFFISGDSSLFHRLDGHGAENHGLECFGFGCGLQDLFDSRKVFGLQDLFGKPWCGFSWA